MKNLKIGVLGAGFIAALLIAGAISVTGTLTTARNVSVVKSTWEAFEAGRSAKGQALSALRKEIGYGGMIHEFKELVLRRGAGRVGLVNQKLGAAVSAVANYRALGLNDSEKSALRDIESMLESYGAASSVAATLVREGRDSLAIDRVVKVDDGPAIRGLDILDEEVTRTAHSWTTVQSKSQALAALRKAMGYNGMIHHFQNYLLRRESHIADNVRRDLVVVRSEIARYYARDLSIAEDEALNNLGIVVDAYEKALQRINSRLEAGESLAVFDQSFSVDDHPALVAFDILTREIALANARDSRRVEKALALVLVIAEATVWTILVGTLFLIVFSVWLFRYRIIRPINRMTRLMTRLAKGDLALNVHAAEQTNEIGEMARAVEVFKDNAIERIRVEKVKGEFVSTVSHELRTPLTSIKGALGLIRSGTVGDISDRLKSLIEIAYNNSDRLVRLINDILDVDKISAGKMEFNMAPINLRGLLEQAIAANKSYDEEYPVDFRLSAHVPVAMVNGDHDRLMQVLANLLSNAVKYSPRDMPIDISLTLHDEKYRISVTDQGPGIPNEFHENVFERFSQADSSDTRQTGGTGLGLNIAKAIVERHDGAIDFQSEAGEGATFYVDLPQWKGSPADMGEAHGRAVQSDHRLPRVLHVEDDPDIVELVLAVVGRRANIFSARSFAEALNLLNNFSYDLVILDLLLPDGNGEELIAAVKNADGEPVPIIVFSAKDVSVQIKGQVAEVLVKSSTSNEALAESIFSAI